MRKKSCALLVAILIIVNSPGGFAQKAEVAFYAGGSFFDSTSFKSPTINEDPHALATTNLHFVSGGVYGVRAREYITQHWAAEQSWTISGTNNLIPNTPGFNETGTVVGTRQRQYYFNGNYFMLASERHIRPYLSGGVGWNTFIPTTEGQAAAANAPFTGLFDNPFYGNFGSDSVFAYNYGAGMTARISNHIALDFSVRDFLFRAPTFRAFDPSQRTYTNNLQVLGGVNWRFGGGAPLIVHNFTVSPTIDASNTALCPGDSAQMHIIAADSIPGNMVTYQWTENGKQVGTGPEYTYVAPSTPGMYDVGVHVFYTSSNLDKNAKKAVDKNPGMPQDRKTTITVKDYNEPTAIASVDQSTVQRGQRVMLTSSATGSECSGNLAYRWSASDGRLIAGQDQTQSIFDGSNLAFSETMQGQQCKPVTVNLEVTDQRGGVGRDSKNLQVCYNAPAVAAAPPPPAPPVAAKPTAIQLSDINFAMNSTRVNNCAKRVLGDELYPQLTSSRYSDYDVVLVGHRDLNEKTTATKASKSTMDRDRVLNAAAYLSASGATCKDLERTRIRVEWRGSEQDADFRSNFCDGSTVTERGRDHVSSADPNAKNRRVEVWLVPRDQTTADSGQDSRAAVAALGCPK